MKMTFHCYFFLKLKTWKSDPKIEVPIPNHQYCFQFSDIVSLAGIPRGV
jgi:hypothetical protein